MVSGNWMGQVMNRHLLTGYLNAMNSRVETDRRTGPSLPFTDLLLDDSVRGFWPDGVLPISVPPEMGDERNGLSQSFLRREAQVDFEVLINVTDKALFIDPKDPEWGRIEGNGGGDGPRVSWIRVGANSIRFWASRTDPSQTDVQLPDGQQH